MSGALADGTAQAPMAGFGLSLEHRPVADLIPYAGNARSHSDAQVALIAGSIREFGFANPILVDGQNGVIAGHGRLLAARKLGLALVPVIELGHLSETQKRAYVLTDNKLAERAGWDQKLLALEVGELSELGLDLSTLGFEAGEIDALLRDGMSDPREEATPEPPADPVSRSGDLSAWSAPRALRRRHRPCSGGAAARRHRASAPGQRSAVRRRLRSGLAQRQPQGPDAPYRQGAE